MVVGLHEEAYCGFRSDRGESRRLRFYSLLRDKARTGVSVRVVLTSPVVYSQAWMMAWIEELNNFWHFSMELPAVRVPCLSCCQKTLIHPKSNQQVAILRPKILLKKLFDFSFRQLICYEIFDKFRQFFVNQWPCLVRHRKFGSRLVKRMQSDFFPWTLSNLIPFEYKPVKYGLINIKKR